LLAQKGYTRFYVGRTFVFEKQGKTRKTEKHKVDYQCKAFIGFSGFYLFYKKTIHPHEILQNL